MTTEADVLARVRLELGDPLTAFQSTVTGDGVTRRYELPGSPVVTSGFGAFTLDTTTTPVTTGQLVPGDDYALDAAEGVIVLEEPLDEGLQLVVQGSTAKYFSDEDMLTFVRTAVRQHLHNRQGVNLTTLPPVEEYLVALLATIEALYTLANDAAFDIDVSTPEGVGIPRSQRFRQLMEMIEARKTQYTELAGQLNVGIARIEMFDLRRVSRTTNRLVPLYLPQEIEDRQPPTRVFAPIDTRGADPIDDHVLVKDIEVYEYGYFTEDYTVEGGIPAGWKVDARIRRYRDSSSLREFTVTVHDAVAGTITLDMDPRQTGQLPQRLFYDIRLTNRTTREVRTLRRGNVTVIQQVGVDEAVGPSTGGGY